MPSAAPSTPSRPSPWREALCPLLVVALTGVAYGHLVGNYFWHEDFYYLYLINDRRLSEYLLTVHGGHVQPVRNLVLWALHALFGARVELYFAVVLLVHLVNALLLFALLRRLTASAPLACFAALLWSTNPLNEGSLGWLSVIGHVMVGTLLLLALLSVQRAADGAARRWEPAGWYAALLLASLSFGTGTGVALVFPVVVALWLPGPPHPSIRRWFWTLPAVTVALYAVFQSLYFRVTGAVDTTVATAPAVLPLLGHMAVMLASLQAVSVAGLVGGPYLVTDHVVQAVLLVAFAAEVAAASLAGPPVLRRRLWAALLLSAGAYALVAAGRAPLLVMSLRSVVDGAGWPRYHYVGSIGTALAIGLLLSRLAARFRPPPLRAAGLLAAWLAWTAVGLWRHPYTTPYWPDPRLEVTRLNFRIARHVTESPSPRRTYILNQHFYSVGPYVSRTDFPGQAGAFIALHGTDRILGKDVYFVEADKEIVAAARRRPHSRTAGLLITGEEYQRLTGEDR